MSIFMILALVFAAALVGSVGLAVWFHRLGQRYDHSLRELDPRDLP